MLNMQLGFCTLTRVSPVRHTQSNTVFQHARASSRQPWSPADTCYHLEMHERLTSEEDYEEEKQRTGGTGYECC